MAHGARLHPDQLSRRRQFQDAHPQVEIVCLGPAWQGVIHQPHGEDVVTRYELGALLDVLEQRLTTPRDPGGGQTTCR
jgi:hypothetical protein